MLLWARLSRRYVETSYGAKAGLTGALCLLRRESRAHRSIVLLYRSSRTSYFSCASDTGPQCKIFVCDAPECSFFVWVFLNVVFFFVCVVCSFFHQRHRHIEWIIDCSAIAHIHSIICTRLSIARYIAHEYMARQLHMNICSYMSTCSLLIIRSAIAHIHSIICTTPRRLSTPRRLLFAGSLLSLSFSLCVHTTFLYVCMLQIDAHYTTTACWFVQISQSMLIFHSCLYAAYRCSLN